MKLWKATQRQCLPVISNVGKFASMKQKIKPDDQYKQELKQYEESIKQIPKIGPDETFDFEDLVLRRREKAEAEAAAAVASSPPTPAAVTPGN
uniref:ATP synthase-coupling factor 6, mitochondrial n=1 Tax=Panagrolaimus sp. PS1159 TaxID=55785 RepID=A0AC35GB61_9BILA